MGGASRSDVSGRIDDLCGRGSVQSVGEETEQFPALSPGSLEEAAMASGLYSVVVVLALSVALAPRVAAGDRNCLSYDGQPFQRCDRGFCCGTCLKRECCTNIFYKFTEDKQEDCISYQTYSSPMPMILGIGTVITMFLIFICCCVCPCCCMYKMCRKPRPVIATTTHTTVVTTTPRQYPQQPTASPGQPQSYQGGQCLIYNPVPVQPQGYGPHPVPQGYGPQPGPQGYGPQPGPQGYGHQPMPQGYGAQAMPTPPYHGQAIAAGPPPTYQEATGPGFPPNPMPYSQAAFSPGQPGYPLQPPVQPQPKGPNPHTDYLAQPAFNPDYTG
ncbi:protein shisa-5-like [Anoplopoma fimbria]|uniref:protein shisa-5-like n=1 Tax=Anoplopoma fimbria TaxID=229290 RepID=UPI0023EDA6FD|nr:protein shisa-5-like [Anoplopoma fimbria]